MKDELISKQAAIRAFAEYEKRTTPSWSGAYKETQNIPIGKKMKLPCWPLT